MTERARGFVRTLEGARKPVKPIVLHGKNNFQGGMELAQRLLEQHPEVTAIFAASDMMAFGSIRALMEAGRRIPDDVSVIGFDNVELSSIVNPALTTIHQPKYEIGQAAVEILLRLAGRGAHQAPEHRIFGVHLLERKSCTEPKS
jgi:DNA-binding LacI/PurR family transcriptional regulator